MSLNKIYMDNYQFEQWCKLNELRDSSYFEYWDDEKQELKKEYNFIDGNFKKMESHLYSNGLISDLKMCVSIIESVYGEQNLIGMDLAAGNLWAVPYLINGLKIEKLYCIEYSKHRLLDIGLKVLDYYNVSRDSIILVYGDFYYLKVEDNTIDFILLSQAFHHAEKPQDLLREMFRVLKPSGCVMIIGETIMNEYLVYIKHIVKYLFSSFLCEGIQRSIFGKKIDKVNLCTNKYELLPNNNIMGDHYYFMNDYHNLFTKNGFKFKRLKRRGGIFDSFFLVKKS